MATKRSSSSNLPRYRSNETPTLDMLCTRWVRNCMWNDIKLCLKVFRVDADRSHTGMFMAFFLHTKRFVKLHFLPRYEVLVTNQSTS